MREARPLAPGGGIGHDAFLTKPQRLSARTLVMGVEAETAKDELLLNNRDLWLCITKYFNCTIHTSMRRHLRSARLAEASNYKSSLGRDRVCLAQTANTSMHFVHFPGFPENFKEISISSQIYRCKGKLQIRENPDMPFKVVQAPNDLW